MVTKSSVKLLYPTLVGLLLGLLQAGLFFQLSLTLSSSYGTYLMVTLCWLIGSALGVLAGDRVRLSLAELLIMALVLYFGCCLLLVYFPFQTSLWPLYAAFVLLISVYPGVFFAQTAPHYQARTLFLLENNGFILGLISGTLISVLLGRVGLLIAPLLVALFVYFLSRRLR
jgi:hypothetical protein